VKVQQPEKESWVRRHARDAVHGSQSALPALSNQIRYSRSEEGHHEAWIVLLNEEQEHEGPRSSFLRVVPERLYLRIIQIGYPGFFNLRMMARLRCFITFG
jgi:hypothetical protein